MPIHGIRKNGNMKKEFEQEAIRKVIKYIKNCIIVGHSVVFDIEILNETLKKYVGDKIRSCSSLNHELFFTSFRGLYSNQFGIVIRIIIPPQE